MIEMDKCSLATGEEKKSVFPNPGGQRDYYSTIA
jgi:hypothetical protein